CEASKTLGKYREAFKDLNWPPEPWFLGTAEGSKGQRKILDQKARTKILDERITEMLTRVSRGEDEISTMLQPIFAAAKRHEAKHLKRAEARKKLDNPPGKKSDPIGDQLSWVQFLDHLKNGDSAWIVSADSDYSVEWNDLRLLNPFLASELTYFPHI